MNTASWASCPPSMAPFLSWAGVWTWHYASVLSNMYPLRKLLPQLANLYSKIIHLLVPQGVPWQNRMTPTYMIVMDRWSIYTRRLGSRSVPSRLHFYKILSTPGPHQSMSFTLSHNSTSCWIFHSLITRNCKQWFKMTFPQTAPIVGGKTNNLAQLGWDRAGMEAQYN